ncbi:hypothetical protein MPDQ_007053 [Monascus purpureus]|uniref:Uncharacterized protein n=1 Tax=Monascus purpureus TaxID=5098 RepID=A0A507R227_MONPU|nr:hypothetical protein MPDQ_007053 [Monascus purpureus]
MTETSAPSASASAPSSRARWIILAIASGTFAALNGLFAKLTTTTQTTALTNTIYQLLHPDPYTPNSSNSPSPRDGNNNDHPLLELTIRIFFLSLNVLSNVTMWALFTRALTAGPSTTKVSITNTASNFLVTAVLGMAVFGEVVGGLWWVGAGLMGGGCVLVGMGHS